MSLRQGQPPFAHRAFPCFLPTTREVVWRLLTDQVATRHYLYGLELVSGWGVGDPITTPEACGTITGQVVHTRVGERLTYTLSAGPSDPAVYLTWCLREVATGTVVVLEVDEPDDELCNDGLEEIWLPVLSALQTAQR